MSRLSLPQLLPIYFMCSLKQTAGAFFTLWFITYVTTLALLAFFRAIGFNFSTFDGASQVSGLAVGLLILCLSFPFWQHVLLAVIGR
jgi:ATP-binding cassette subfamily G (WHITE) protein 2 (SNQ2)